MRGLLGFIIVLQIIICSWIFYEEREKKFNDYRFIPLEHVLYQRNPRLTAGFFLGYLIRKGDRVYLLADKKAERAADMYFHISAARIWIPTDQINNLCENTYVVVRGNLHSYSGLPAIDDVLSVDGYENEGLNCYQAKDGTVNYYERGFAKKERQ